MEHLNALGSKTAAVLLGISCTCLLHGTESVEFTSVKVSLRLTVAWTKYWLTLLQIEGLGLAVKKALVATTGRLQEFPPLEKTTYGTRPPESESLPIQTVDLPLQRRPTLQSTPSDSINHAWGGHPSLASEKVSNMNSRTPQQEVVFKILCPNELVGGIIGKGGSIVKAVQNESGASISIGSTLADCDERLITITAMEVNLFPFYHNSQVSICMSWYFALLRILFRRV